MPVAAPIADSLLALLTLRQPSSLRSDPPSAEALRAPSGLSARRGARQKRRGLTPPRVMSMQVADMARTAAELEATLNKRVRQDLPQRRPPPGHLANNATAFPSMAKAHRARNPLVLTSPLIAQAVNKSVDEIRPMVEAQHRVAYQGVPGAYSESAARKACPGSQPLPCEQFEVAFQALTQWLADTAVLPIENSVGGSIHTVFDLLIRYRLHIVGEVSVDVRHCLMALPGTRREDIKRVQSHPQALSQCDSYLRGMRGVTCEAVYDTAGAAEGIATHQLRDVAAIASERAAELYGLEVLDRNIQDARDNVTRFIVLSRDPLIVGPSNWKPLKTSIAFSLPRSAGEAVPGPGQLFKALSVFALRGVDMTKIESRPMRQGIAAAVEHEPDMAGTPAGRSSGNGAGAGAGAKAKHFDYLFYVDLVGGLGDDVIQNALRHLQEITPFLRVLGCYPMDLDAGDAVTSREAIVASDAELLGNQAQELLRTGSWSSARTPAEWRSDNGAGARNGAGAAAAAQQTVAFQGVAGSMVQGVAAALVPGCTALPCEELDTAFHVLSQWAADKALLPIECNETGSFHAVYDLLLRYRLHIVAEACVEVDHCLSAMPGVRARDLARVVSDPRALAHCDPFLRAGLPGVVREAVHDTTAAAKLVAEHRWMDVGAISSESAADHYGLHVLERGIGRGTNVFRFLLLAREPLVTTRGAAEAYKTSVVFSVPEGPGQLFKALSVFALRDLDMTKIESRPMRSNPIRLADSAVGGRRFRYLFYVDFVGNLAEDAPQNALRHLNEVSDFMRVLGCYPMSVEAPQA